jgi:sirohydrochlorin cobaltochelatase
MKRGLFILAHGSRSPEAKKQLENVVESIEKKGEAQFQFIESGAMELSKPSFPEGIQRLIDKGAEEIVIVPLFLFFGNHIKKDIPRILEDIKTKHPEVKFTLTSPIGEDPRIVDILIEKGNQAL